MAAVSAAPSDVALRIALGAALAATAQHEAAAIQFLKASRLKPAALEPRLLLADALADTGKWSQAIAVLEQTASSFPDESSVWSRKGALERKSNQVEAAARSFAVALRLNPGDADNLNNLGVIARAQGDLVSAIDYYQRSLAARPSALAYANLGNALDAAGRTAEARECLRAAHTLDPYSIDAAYNLAAHEIRSDAPEEALALLSKVTAQAPERWDAWTNRGVAELAVGRVHDAERSYRRALALKPMLPEAEYDLAWILLLTGRWGEGWTAFESRWRLPRFAKRPAITAPEWDGADLGDGTLLIYSEQGFGDGLQMIRYAVEARRRAGSVIVLCPPALHRLFATVAGVDRVVTTEAEVGAVAARVAMMSLPHLFAVETTQPPASAYLTRPAAQRFVLPKKARRRIGFAWAGSPDNKIDRIRTCDAAHFVRLLSGVDAEIVNLQVGAKAKEFTAAGGRATAFDCDGAVTDFHDTAEIVAQLDLIIAVDTAVVHLAGAMGIPAWVLLPYMPDYRWLLDRADSPWYGSVRLFRQRRRGDWNQVFGDVAAALTKW